MPEGPDDDLTTAPLREDTLENPRRLRQGNEGKRHTLPIWARRVRYGVGQGMRMAWYGAHSSAMKRIVDRVGKDMDTPAPEIRKPKGPVPSQKRMMADIARLLGRDLANVEAGYYPMPRDEAGGLPALLRRSRHFLKDVPEVARRRRTGAHQEVAGADDALPRYYRQNFHFQTDGWLSEDSARLYDFQVEVLFTGAAAAMRRQGLLPLVNLARRQDQRRLTYADIACGTGAFLRDVSRALPRLSPIALDLSEPYLHHTRDRVKSARLREILAQAESLPLADASLDAASIVYLFHELPPKIRRQVVAEIARVLRPGGIFILVDSLQTGDRPDYDGLLELFPQLFHEPYYGTYLREDLDTLCASQGLFLDESRTAFVSKINVYRKASV